MKKAFTIIELLVAMALLAILIAISGLVFSAAVRAYRTAGAASEIAAKLATLTNRLDRDLQSLVPGMPIAIWFEYDPPTGRRFDQIQFFSTGDTFESWKQWTYTKSLIPLTVATETLSGNTARIYYGHANQVRISGLARASYRNYNYAFLNPAERATETILARRAHLLGLLDLNPTRRGQFPANIITTTIPYTLDYSVPVFQANFLPWFIRAGNAYGNDVFEYDDTTLSDWINILSNSTNVDQYLKTCFIDPTAANPIDSRPGVDLTASDGQSLHMILAQGVGSFSIQWAYTSEDMRWMLPVPDSDLNRPVFNQVRWWPSTDPDGNGNPIDSDFSPAVAFGCYMRFPSNPSPPAAGWPWYGISGCLSRDQARTWRFRSDYFPKAIKFTFTLYDSNGVFKDGKTFTHIVYLNE